MLDKVVGQVSRVIDANHILVNVAATGAHNVNAYPAQMVVTVDKINTGFFGNLFQNRSQQAMVNRFSGQYVDLDITGASTTGNYAANIQDIATPQQVAAIATATTNNRPRINAAAPVWDSRSQGAAANRPDFSGMQHDAVTRPTYGIVQGDNMGNPKLRF
jgi:hypothetical protein